MASDLEQKAKEAFIDDQLELPMELYNQAIDLNPNYAELYADRAQANIKLNKLTEESTDLLKNSIENNNTTNDSAIDFQPVNDVSNQATELSVKPKYRHQYYENAEEVVVTILGKKIPAKNVFVEYGEQILSVTIDVPGEDPYHFQPRLFAKILPAKCRYDVLSTKIEIRLAKAEPIRWKSLEFSKEISVPQTVSASAVGSRRPDYPSSKPKKVNWDKLEAQMKKEEKEEKLDGDAALNQFFRDVYNDADEDTRRAMQKSFVESNGTVLNTNWNEVGSKKVDGSPPDGMEVKKWEY